MLAYETGFKWDGLFGGTTRFNGSVYYYDYDDYQGFFFNQIAGWVRNVDAEYKGVEFELFASPVDNVDLMLNFSYIDAEIFDVQLGPGIFVDTEPSFTPHTQIAGLIRYSWPPRPVSITPLNSTTTFEISTHRDYPITSLLIYGSAGPAPITDGRAHSSSTTLPTSAITPSVLIYPMPPDRIPWCLANRVGLA